MTVLNFLKQKKKAITLSLSLDYSIQSRELNKAMENKCITLEVTTSINGVIRNKHKLMKRNNWGSALCVTVNQSS